MQEAAIVHAGGEDVVELSELAVEVARLWPPQGQWTEADYFALPDTNRFVELSEGELIVPPHPTETHQRVVMELAFRMRAFVDENGLGTIRFAPLPVRLWPGKIREPDVLFVTKDHADRMGEQVYGVPDLVVEVLSPGTWRLDRHEKFSEYARAGVEEYWMVDPEKQTIEVFMLRWGAYELLGRWGKGEVARSELLAGFEVAVDEVVGEGEL